MTKLLKNKTAIITGASRGIGKGIAKSFAKHGANIVFSYHSSVKEAKELEVELRAYGVEVKGIQSDAVDFKASQNLANSVIKEFSSIDVLINNAGITKDNLLMRISEEDFDRVIQTNLKSVFNLTRAVISQMIKQRSGSIINMSSVVAIKGNAGQSNYCASKAGILGFTRSIAVEVGSRNIRCNAIAPGFIKTEMTDLLVDATSQKLKDSIPLKRVGSVEDVADACVFLASDMSSYITGQTLQVNGGMLTS